MKTLRKRVSAGLLDRLLFTAIILGILAVAYGGLRYLSLSNQLAGNMSAQIRAEGGEVALESKAQAQGLVAADVERRRLVAEQNSMMILGGSGLALLGAGWLGMDLLRARRRKGTEAATAATATEADVKAPEMPV